MASSSARQPLATVVRAALAAYDSGRWADFAALVDPTELAEFREEHLDNEEGWEQGFARMDARHGVIPADVDDFFLEMWNEARRTAGSLTSRQFAHVNNIESLRKLSPAEFLARYLEVRNPPEDPDHPPGAPAQIAVAVHRELIGEVPEDDELVHVVYRVYYDIRSVGSVEAVHVLAVRKGPDGWRIMLNEDLSPVLACAVRET